MNWKNCLSADRALGCAEGSIARPLAVVASKSTAQAPLLLTLPPSYTNVLFVKPPGGKFFEN